MIEIDFDLNNNSVLLDGKPTVLRRIGSARLLQSLIVKGGHGLDFSLWELEQDRAANGATSKLTRTQVARLIDDIALWIQTYAVDLLELKFGARRSTVGPWAMLVKRPCKVTDLRIGAKEPSLLFATGGNESWAYPQLVRSSEIEALLDLLTQWLIFEGFVAYGENKDALVSLPLASNFSLTDEGKVLLDLRKVYLLRRLGQHNEARAICKAIIDREGPLRDPRLVQQAHFAIARIEYDEDPANKWQEARKLAERPMSLLIPCPLTRSEWHNLQALCARRAAVEAAATNKDLNEARSQHAMGLAHLHSAIYYALGLQNWDRLHAYLDNLSYHMQQMQTIGIGNVDLVSRCFALSLACADKLDSGHDDAWDLIYFAQFWLGTYQKLKGRIGEIDSRVALVNPKLNPANLDFWLYALERAKSIGGNRQIAITIVLTLQWLKLSPNKTARGKLQQQLSEELSLMFSTDEKLKAKLVADGYCMG
jgi:hypothetical protein